MIWDVDKINEYRLNLQNYSSAKFDEMLSISPNTDNLSSSVNEVVVAFTDGIRLAADPIFLKTFDNRERVATNGNEGSPGPQINGG